MLADRAEQRLGGPRRTLEALAKAIEIVECHRGVRPSLPQAAAEHAALMVEVCKQIARAGEHRAAGGIEVFVQGHIDGVEEGGVSPRRYPRIGRSQEQPGAVEMEPDPALASKGSDALHFVEIEDLADDAAHRRLDRDPPTRGAN